MADTQMAGIWGEGGGGGGREGGEEGGRGKVL